MIGTKKQIGPAKRDSRPLPIDLDLLPAEYRRRVLSRVGLLLILVAVLALVPLYPAMQARQRMNDEAAQLQANLTRMRAQIAQLQATEAQVKSLQAAIADAQSKFDTMQNDYAALNGSRVNWQPVLSTVYSALPSNASIDQITQQGAKLTVQGKAQSYDAVVAYAKQLKESGSFISVSPQLGEVAGQGVSFILTLQAKAGSGA